MADAHKNFAYTTVTAAPSPAASGTSLTVADGTVLPDVPFNATVWATGANPLNSNAEIVRVTNNVAGVLTITRTQEGTSARSIVIGDQFAATITAKVLTDAELTISDGTNTQGSGTIRLSNANGVSFGLNAGTLTASHNALTTAALSNHSHGDPQLNLTNLTGTTASNSAGLTLSLSANPAQTVQPGIQSVSAGTTRVTTGEVVWSNANGVSFGANGQTITASHNGLTSQSNQNITAANGGFAFQTLSFSNLNGISFGTSAGSAITASHNALTTARASTDAIGLNTAQSNVTWTVNSSGLSLDARGYAGTGTTFAGANISASITLNSVGLNLSASVAAPGGAGFSAGVSNLGNTGGDTGVSGTRLVLVGSQNITLNQATDVNGATVSISGGAGAAGNTGYISAGAATASLGTVVFSNSNGLSFGVNGQTVTGSHNGLTSQSSQSAIKAFGVSNTGQTAGNTGVSTGIDWVLAGSQSITLSQSTAAGGPNTVWVQHPAWLTTAMQSNAVTLSNIRVSAGTTSNLLSALTLADGNGISFGINASTITASHNALTSQSNQAFSADASSTFQTLSFQDSNGISFSNNAGALRLTHALQFTSATSAITSNALHTSVSRVINIVAATNNTGGGTASLSSNVSFSNANGATFYTSAGGAVVLSYTVPAGGGAAISAGANSQNTGTVNFANSNGITFGLSNNGTLTASHNGLTTARASTDAIGLNTAQTNVTWTVNSSGLSLNAAGYAGTGTTFAGANISASITLNSVGLNLSASVAAPGAAAENNAINLLGANTAGNTTATGSTIGWSGLNLTLSGTNASQVVISAPATSSLSATGLVSLSTNGSTISIGVSGPDTRNYFNPQDGYVQVAGQQGQASMHIQPMYAPNVTFDRVAMPVVVTNATNSTGTVTCSFGLVIYTRNASTLSSLSSTSASQAVTFSGTVNNSTYAGMRLFTFPWSSSLSEAQYYLGIWSRTTTGGANATVNQFLASQVNSVFSGILGAASNATVQYTRGLGVYSATFSTALPGSVAMSQIQGTASAVLRQPVIYFANGTF